MYDICLSEIVLFHLLQLSLVTSIFLKIAYIFFLRNYRKKKTFHCPEHYIFPIYFSAVGHLGYFHNSAIVNNATITMVYKYPRDAL